MIFFSTCAANDSHNRRQKVERSAAFWRPSLWHCYAFIASVCLHFGKALHAQNSFPMFFPFFAVFLIIADKNT